jgi:glycerophosphoryl diester phosphodiesterase
MRWAPASRRLDWLIARPIAHRGLHDAAKHVIENTPSAFQAAIAANYAIECDLQVSRDGEALVFHDETLDRLTEAKGLVREYRAEELKALKFRSGGDHMQTLDELLAQVEGRVPLVIELKSLWNGDDALVRRAAVAIGRYEGAFAFMSFDPKLIEKVRDLAPQVARGIVADRVTHSDYDVLPVAERIRMRALDHLEATQPDFISYHWADLPYPPVTKFRQGGRPVICWTIRSPQQAAQARRHADQITFEGFLA